MTFDWKPNDIRMTQFIKVKIDEIAQSMNPDSWQSSFKGEGARYDVTPLQAMNCVRSAVGWQSEKILFPGCLCRSPNSLSAAKQSTTSSLLPALAQVWVTSRGKGCEANKRPRALIEAA